MPKSRNMGRSSHMAQDNQLNSSRPAQDAASLTEQPTRPTQHPSQGTKASDEQPMRKHSRRGD